MLVSVVNYLLGEGNIFFEGKVRTVNHDAGETVVDAFLADFEAVSVVEVEHDFWLFAAKFLSILYSTLGHVAEDSAVSISTGTLGNLHDDGRFGLHSSLHNSLHLLHSVKVESGDGVATCNGLLEHLAGVHKTQFFVACHKTLMKIWFVCWVFVLLG